MIEYLGWTGSALLVIGMYLVGQKRRAGFAIGFCGEALWVLKSYMLWQTDLLAICVVFLAVYAWNFHKWGRPPQLKIYES